MKKRIVFGLIISAQLFSSCQSVGQVQKEYIINFRSGIFSPLENVQEVIREPKLLSASQFNNRYYVVFQFYNLPDSSVKRSLAEMDIKLLHYLPQIAYVASIPVQSNLRFLVDSKVRSVFVMTAEQKMAIELQKKRFPAWSVPQKGYIDITVSTFELFDLSKIEKSIFDLQGQVLSMQNEFSTMTVRLPQKNLHSFARLPFVFWMEPVGEPAKPEKVRTNMEQ